MSEANDRLFHLGHLLEVSPDRAMRASWQSSHPYKNAGLFIYNLSPAIIKLALNMSNLIVHK